MLEREFISYCDELVRASQNCKHRWTWVHKGERSYIRLEKKVTSAKPGHCAGVDGDAMNNFVEADLENDPACASVKNIERILSFEYHVLYSESYEVPSLLFNIYGEGGERFNLEEAWNTINICEIVPSSELYQTITMVHHPILFLPFLNLHPCKTFELLASLSCSINPIISFLTSYGPFVNLELDEVSFLLLRSNSGDSVIQNQSPVAHVGKVALHDIWNDVQKQRCLRWIEQQNLKRIALQLPDILLHHSVEIVNQLQSESIVEFQTFVLADTSYGSCCVDEIAAAHANADGVIHFGHACLSKVARIPVLYVFFQFTIDEEHLFATLSSEFVPSNVHVTCFYEVCYANAVAAIREKLLDCFPNMVVASLAEDNQIADILCWKLEVPHNPKDTILYIGRDNLSFFNNAVALEASQCWLYDPTNSKPQLVRIDPIGAKWLRRRYYAIERCMDAGSIGIVVATLSTKGYLEIVSRVQRLAKARGVRTYLISIGKVNPEKLANFVDIDCFVLVGCPENDIFTSRDFFRPLLSVFEAEMAFNKTWKEKLLRCYTMNFSDLLPDGRLYTNVDETSLNTEEGNAPPDVSLITGKARHVTHQREADNVETVENGSCTDVAHKGRNDLAQISSADQFTCRSWQGLEQNLGQDAPAVVQMGRSGIPVKYENENSRLQ